MVDNSSITCYITGVIKCAHTRVSYRNEKFRELLLSKVVVSTVPSPNHLTLFKV